MASAIVNAMPAIQELVMRDSASRLIAVIVHHPSFPDKTGIRWVTRTELLGKLGQRIHLKPPITMENFLRPDAYSPLPTIVQAARQ